MRVLAVRADGAVADAVPAVAPGLVQGRSAAAMTAWPSTLATRGSRRSSAPPRRPAAPARGRCPRGRSPGGRAAGRHPGGRPRGSSMMSIAHTIARTANKAIVKARLRDQAAPVRLRSSSPQDSSSRPSAVSATPSLSAGWRSRGRVGGRHDVRRGRSGGPPPLPRRPWAADGHPTDGLMTSSKRVRAALGGRPTGRAASSTGRRRRGSCRRSCTDPSS